MLEPVRVPLIKTLKDFYAGNFKEIDHDIWKSDDSKNITDAFFGGPVFLVIGCKTFKFDKERGCRNRKKMLKSYVVEEPVQSSIRNLFVPFSSPYVDKFQG